ncbi:MAG: hypothetical protein JST10_16900 [Bacteroidetes bacterium]|nr:hypothetical protein [Bacteroidota bacterium]MBS1634241.1 hypothetical protein [Bacteroidota bacterium]
MPVVLLWRKQLFLGNFVLKQAITHMKNLRFFLVLISLLMLVSSCRLWSSVFRPKYGCPTNGKNVGAERILSGDPGATRASEKAKKFKS